MKSQRLLRLIVPTAIVAVAGTAAVASAAGTADTSSSTTRVLVQYQPGVSTDEQSSLEHANGASRIATIDDISAVVLSVPSGAAEHVIDAFNRSGDTTYAETDGTAQAVGTTSGTTGVTPSDTYWGSQWGPKKINTPTAWSTTTGTALVVADVDTGIDYSHPDLQGKTVAGYDFVQNDTTPQDDNGHGTATAGIIAANTNNGTGIAGMCWSCKIMPVKALDSSGSGSYSWIANAITWAADHGASIINLSLGGTSNSTTLHNAVTYAYNKGVLLVAAAGNAGTTGYNYPGAFPETLSVAATDSNDKRYSWSTYGSWVDVAAPGCDYATSLGGGYNSNFCGTSAATPVVTGLAALLKSANSGAANTSLMNTIESTSVSVGTIVKYGRVDAAAAMASVGSAPSPSPSTGTNTATYSDSINNGNPSRSYAVSAGTGTLTANVTFAKVASMTVNIVSSGGSVLAQSTSGSPVTASASVSSGNYSVVVSGSGHISYTLTVTSPKP